MSRWCVSAGHPERDYVLDVLAANATEPKLCGARWWMRWLSGVYFVAAASWHFFRLLFAICRGAAGFNAKLDPIVATLFGLSKFVRALRIIEAGTIVLIVGGGLCSGAQRFVQR
jgi:hypothetical protein